MPFIALALVLLIPFALVVLMPLSLVQRYRVGTTRRLARGWVAAVNLFFVFLSAALLLLTAAAMSPWLPQGFPWAVAGLGTGGLLGAAGLWATRWEATPRGLLYTPNRWLVLAITLVVTARLLFGLWRSWQAWQGGTDLTAWLAASGAAGSLAAGALVLGYYLVYWFGVRRRLRTRRR